MCLILFAWQCHPRYSLVVAANREEFHARPTAAADFWEHQPDLLAGRDLQAGGTWLGATRGGRFAAITNYREPLAPQQPLQFSRGHLVRDSLVCHDSPITYAQRLLGSSQAYRGFNLLTGDQQAMAYVSNRLDHVVEVEPGSHALSNHLLDTDWPKVQHGRTRLNRLLSADSIEPEALLGLLADQQVVSGQEPVDFNPALVPEPLTRKIFVQTPDYGTRSSTVLLIDRAGRVEFIERQFAPDGRETQTRRFEFTVSVPESMQPTRMKTSRRQATD